MRRALPKINAPLSDSGEDNSHEGDDILRFKLPKSNVTRVSETSEMRHGLPYDADSITLTRLPKSNVTTGACDKGQQHEVTPIKRLKKSTALLPVDHVDVVVPNVDAPSSTNWSAVDECKAMLIGSDSGVLGSVRTLLANKHTAIEARAVELKDLILNDTSPMALRPSNPLQLEEMLKVVLSLKANSYVASTMAQDNGSNWNWWKSWCRTHNASPIRIYYESRATLQEQCREHFLWTAAIPWILVRMKPGPGRVVPKPQSAAAVLRGIRRIHVGDLDLEPPPSRMLNRVLRGIMNRYAELHGPESLQPHRTVPIPHSVTAELHRLYRSFGVEIAPGLVTDGATSLYWSSVAALSAVHKETGLRKAETTSISKKLTKLDLSLRHCRWNIDGRYVSGNGPTREELEAMVPGQCLQFRSVTPL